MKENRLPKKIQIELPKKNDLFGEKLDFSELINVKGGKRKEDQASGNSGGFICWCK